MNSNDKKWEAWQAKYRRNFVLKGKQQVDNLITKRMIHKRFIVLVVLALIASLFVFLFPARIEFSRSEAAEIEHRTVKASVSGYSSSKDQTDENPFITANGDTVGSGTIACPSEFDFGTKIEIKGEEYVCNDRMHKRYRNESDPYYFDIWFESRKEAVEFGRQNLEVIIKD